MKQIGASIADGAMAFLKAEYQVLSNICYYNSSLLILAFAANSQGDSWLVSISFLVWSIGIRFSWILRNEGCNQGK